jgi:hypothetical protein
MADTVKFMDAEVAKNFELVGVQKDFSVIMAHLPNPYRGPVSGVTPEAAAKLVEEGHPWIQKKATGKTPAATN